MKGYALIEFASLPEAQKAVNELNGSSFMGRTISVNFAFKKPMEGDNKNKYKKWIKMIYVLLKLISIIKIENK